MQPAHHALSEDGRALLAAVHDGRLEAARALAAAANLSSADVHAWHEPAAGAASVSDTAPVLWSALWSGDVALVDTLVQRFGDESIGGPRAQVHFYELAVDELAAPALWLAERYGAVSWGNIRGILDGIGELADGRPNGSEAILAWFEARGVRRADGAGAVTPSGDAVMPSGDAVMPPGDA